MGNKHREDIFNAIRDALLEQEEKEERINYSELYRTINDELRRSKKRQKFTLSQRDFTSELNMLVKEGRLLRIEEKKSKNKIKPVYFTLTESAKKERQLEILGVDSQTERRRKLYQLLLFYEAGLAPWKQVSSGRLKEFLSNLSKSTENLDVDIKFHVNNTNYTEIVYKPLQFIRLREVELINAKKILLYYYQHLSFSSSEIIRYLEDSLRNDKNSGEPSFVRDIGFTQRELREEFQKALDALIKARLIKRVSGHKFEDEGSDNRFIISNEQLRTVINIIFMIRNYRLEIQHLKSKTDEPDIDGIKLFENAYGRNVANKIISEYRLGREKAFKMKNKNMNQVKVEISLLQDLIDNTKQMLNERYRMVLQEYAIPTILLEEVC